MMTCFGHCGPSSGHKITGKTICSVSTQPQEAKLVLVKSPQDTKTYTTRSIRNNAVLTLHYKGHRRYLKVQEYRTYRHNLTPTGLPHPAKQRHFLRQTPSRSNPPTEPRGPPPAAPWPSSPPIRPTRGLRLTSGTYTARMHSPWLDIRSAKILLHNAPHYGRHRGTNFHPHPIATLSHGVSTGAHNTYIHL